MHCMSNICFFLAFLHFSNFCTGIGYLVQCEPRASGIKFDFYPSLWQWTTFVTWIYLSIQNLQKQLLIYCLTALEDGLKPSLKFYILSTLLALLDKFEIFKNILQHVKTSIFEIVALKCVIWLIHWNISLKNCLSAIC